MDFKLLQFIYIYFAFKFSSIVTNGILWKP